MARFGNVAPSGARERVAAPVGAFGGGQEDLARGAGLAAVGQGLGQLGAQLAAEEKVESVKRDRLALGTARTEFLAQMGTMEAEENATRGVNAVGTRSRVEQKTAAIIEAMGGSVPESQTAAWQSFVGNHRLRSSATARKRETKELDTATNETMAIELAATDQEVGGLWAGAIEWQGLDGLRERLVGARGAARKTVADRDGWSAEQRNEVIRQDSIYVDAALAKKIASDWKEMGLSEETAIEHLEDLGRHVPTKGAIRSIRMEGAVDKTLDEVTGAGGGLPLEIDGEIVEGESIEANFDTATGRLVQREAADRFIQKNYGDLPTNDRLQIQGVVYSQLRRAEVARDAAYAEQITNMINDPAVDLDNLPTGGVFDRPDVQKAFATARLQRTNVAAQSAAIANLPSLIQNYDLDTDQGRVAAFKISALLEMLPTGVVKNSMKAEFSDVLSDDLTREQKAYMKRGMSIVDQAIIGNERRFKRKKPADQLEELKVRDLLREELRDIAKMEPGKEKDARTKEVLAKPRAAAKRLQLMERLQLPADASTENK